GRRSNTFEERSSRLRFRSAPTPTPTSVSLLLRISRQVRVSSPFNASGQAVNSLRSRHSRCRFESALILLGKSFRLFDCRSKSSSEANSRSWGGKVFKLVYSRDSFRR